MLIRVLLVEGMDLLRSALRSLLAKEADIEVLAAVKHDDTVPPVADRLRPDVVVIDVDVSRTADLTIIEELRRRLPDTQVVALTSSTPAGLVRRLLATGVLGAVDKNAPAARLLEAIRGAAAGERVIDASLALAAVAAAPNPLTPREHDVLRLASDGAALSEIAQQLHLAPGTVRNYLSKIITKTSAHTRVDAVRIARQAGWI